MNRLTSFERAIRFMSKYSKHKPPAKRIIDMVNRRSDYSLCKELNDANSGVYTRIMADAPTADEMKMLIFNQLRLIADDRYEISYVFSIDSDYYCDLPIHCDTTTEKVLLNDSWIVTDNISLIHALGYQGWDLHPEPNIKLDKDITRLFNATPGVMYKDPSYCEYQYKWNPCPY